MKKRTAQLLAQLKTLAASAKDNLYKRIGIASQVIDDVERVATEHGGDVDKAYDSLQENFFCELGGGIFDLSEVIEAYRNTSEDLWKQNRYNIALVVKTYRKQLQSTMPEEKGERTSWKKVAAERLQRVEQLEKQVAQLLETNGKLREENTELRAKVSRMEGRIEEMERCRMAGAR